jgi:fumarate reductase subunit D
MYSKKKKRVENPWNWNIFGMGNGRRWSAKTWTIKFI